VHLLWTLAGTLAAFLLGSATGILVGLLFVAYPKVEQFIDPIFAGLNALPRIALAPLFLLWFGLGISSKIALGFSLTFFIVLSSTIAGARSVNSDHLMLADTLGASSTQIFRRITLPSAVPTVFSGLRLGLIYALLGVIAGEIIAAQHGLGQSLTFLAGTFQINGVFAVLLLLAMLGMSLTWIMTAVEARLLRWR
jgi:NitT/TauT family transport system permease protein